MADEFKKNGPSKISTLLDDVIKPVFKARGFHQHKLLTDWPLIVGGQLAQVTIPQKIASRSVKGNKEHYLHIDVSSSAAATQLQFMEPVILEKIAVYFGYKAIHGLKIQQRPSEARRAHAEKNIVLTDEQNQLLVSLTGAITDDELQYSLQELGKNILGHIQKKD